MQSTCFYSYLFCIKNNLKTCCKSLLFMNKNTKHLNPRHKAKPIKNNVLTEKFIYRLKNTLHTLFRTHPFL